MAPRVPGKRLSWLSSHEVKDDFLSGTVLGSSKDYLIESLSWTPVLTSFEHLMLREAWELLQGCKAGKWWKADLILCFYLRFPVISTEG